MKRSEKTLLGFLAGVVVGAGIYAFLNSPEGQAWIKRMKKQVGEWKEDFEDLVKQEKEMAEGWEEDEESAAS